MAILYLLQMTSTKIAEYLIAIVFIAAFFLFLMFLQGRKKKDS